MSPLQSTRRATAAPEHDPLTCGLGRKYCPGCEAEDAAYIPDPLASFGDALGFIDDVGAKLIPVPAGLAVVVPGREPDPYTMAVVQRHKLDLLYAVLGVSGPVIYPPHIPGADYV